MKFELDLSKQNSPATHRFILRTIKPVLLWFQWAAYALAPLYLFILFADLGQPALVGLIISAFLILAVLGCYLRYRTINNIVASATIRRGTTMLEFTDERLIMKNDAVSSEVKLSHVHDVIDGKKLGIIVQIGMLETITIPQEIFENEKHKQDCLREIKSRIERARQRPPRRAATYYPQVG